MMLAAGTSGAASKHASLTPRARLISLRWCLSACFAADGGISGYPSRFHAKPQLTISRRRKKLSPQCAVPVAGAASMSLNPSIAFRHEIGGAIRGSRSAVTARAHGSTGRERPGNPPHSGVLSAAGGVVLAEDSGLAPLPSDKDARWHD